MPEGPEVRRDADRIARVLRGQVLEAVDYRLPALARRGSKLRGRRVLDVTTRGKAFLIAYEGGLTHYSHHQLYGRWDVVAPGAAPDPRLQLRVRLATRRGEALLYSATQVELLDAAGVAAHRYLSALGPDVLDRDCTAARIARRLADPVRARSRLASLLLDQGFFAGLGNYLRSDILFEAQLAPTLCLGDLDAPARARLARAIRTLPRRSYATGGIVTDATTARKLARAGAAYEDLRFLVYDRDGRPCRRCGHAIRRTNAGGRGLFYCPACQCPPGRSRRTL